MHLIILIKNAVKHAQQENDTTVFVSFDGLSGIAELKAHLDTSQHGE